MTSGLFKMEGSGNDFLLGIGEWADRMASDSDLVRRLCDRRRGVGADGTLSIDVRSAGVVTLKYRNADGSEGRFCANGTRCAARAGVELLACDRELKVVTGWAEIPAEVRGDTVSLVLPAIEGAPRKPGIEVAEPLHEVVRLVVGVPHLVVRVSGLAELDLEEIGPPLRRHPGAGPDGANVMFYEIDEDGAVAVRSWERGVEDETLSCGSGSVATALVVMAARGHSQVVVRTASGDRLKVEALGYAPVCAARLTGPTRMVAEIHPSSDFLAEL